MSLITNRVSVVDDFAAIRERQRELSKPAPIVCTCTSGGRWVPRMAIDGSVLQMLLPDPECRVHGDAAFLALWFARPRKGQ